MNDLPSGPCLCKASRPMYVGSEVRCKFCGRVKSTKTKHMRIDTASQSDFGNSKHRATRMQAFYAKLRRKAEKRAKRNRGRR